jgi:hypothetical protein
MSETSDDVEKDKIILSVIKLTSILVLFFLVIIIGTLPLRVRNFKLNKVIIMILSSIKDTCFFYGGILWRIVSFSWSDPINP